MKKIVLLLLASAAVAWSLSGSPTPQTDGGSQAVIKGMVKSSLGKPVDGAAVSARSAGRTFTMTVYTDTNGNYSFPPLDSGQYTIRAQAVGFEGAVGKIGISGSKTAARDLVLKPLQEFASQLSAAEFLASLPGGSVADETREKALFVNNCTACHQASFVLQNRFDAAGWNIIVDLMSHTGGLGAYQKERVAFPIIQSYRDELVGFLTRVRGPNSPPLRYKLAPRPRGEAARVVITEYDLPPGEAKDYFSVHNGTDWSLGTPSAYEGRSAHDLAIDRDGNVWFTDQASPERTLGKLDVQTGKVTDWKLLSRGGSAGNGPSEDNLTSPRASANPTTAGSHGISIDGEGNLWMTNSPDGELAKFDPRTDKFVRYARPAGMTPIAPTYVNIDSKGNVWGVTKAGVLKLDPKTAQYTEYKSVTAGGDHYGQAIDSDDNVWFTQMGKDRLGYVDAKTGRVGQVILPKSELDATARDLEVASRFDATNISAPPQVKGPRRMGADAAGDSVWVTEYSADRLAEVNIHTKKVTEYPVPRLYTQPYAVAVDRNHMVWVCTFSDVVLRFDPGTKTFTEYVLPTRGTETRFIAVDNRTTPPTVWLPYWRANKIARLQFK